MGIRLKRKKPRNILLSLIYRIHKLLPLSSKRKFKIYLDLEWIFDRLSHETSFEFYDESNHPLRQYSKAFILKQITGNHKVIDLGCKHGYISNYIAEKAKSVVGIDLDEAAISMAKNKYNRDNLRFEVAEAFSYLNKQSEKFEVLILSHILEHLDEPKEFLLKFKHHFKYIYIEVPDFDRYYLNHYRSDVDNKLIYSDNDHISEFDRHELRALIAECKMNIIKEEYIFGVQKIWCEVLNEEVSKNKDQ